MVLKHFGLSFPLYSLKLLIIANNFSYGLFLSIYTVLKMKTENLKIFINLRITISLLYININNTV